VTPEVIAWVNVVSAGAGAFAVEITVFVGESQ
jgi:hypothetical protein